MNKSNLSFSRGIWCASWHGEKVRYSVSRFGDYAEILAKNALEQMKAGTFNRDKEYLELKMVYQLNEAARLLEMESHELRQWMLTGFYNNIEMKPPEEMPKEVSETESTSSN